MAYDTEVLADSPIAYWRLDDATSAVATDATGNGLDGIQQGSTITALSSPLIPVGTCFAFDNDQLISAADAQLQLDVDVTWEFWIQFDSGDPLPIPVQPMVLSSDTLGIRSTTLTDTLDEFGLDDFNGHTAQLPCPTLAYDTPYYIVITYDDSTQLAELYIDGAFVVSDTVNGSGLDPIGATDAHLSFGQAVWKGDEVAVYDVVLSSTRIGVHYAEGFGGGGTQTYEQEVMADTPELYWRLDETTVTTAIDSSGNSHNGTSTVSGGATLSALIEGLITQGTAWEFDDDTGNAYVNSSTGAGLAATDFTMELWLQYGSASANVAGLLTLGSNIPLEIRTVAISSARSSLTISDNGGVNSAAIPFVDALTLAVPHYLVITYDDATETVEVWIDNVSQGTDVVGPGSWTPFPTPSAVQFGIGQGFVLGPNVDDLVLDEVAFYDYVLADGRITAHYDAGLLVYNNAMLLGVARQAVTGGVFLSQPGQQIADIKAQLLDIDDMDNPVLQLDQAVDYTWQDPFSEPGAGRIELMNDDPDLASIAAQSLVRFDYKGWAAFTMICEQYARTTVSQDEESGESTVWEGRGHLALLERGLVYPSGGVGRQPIADDRGFNWSSVEYDDGAWLAATLIMTAGAAKTTWGGGPPLVIDPDWPDDTAGMIWASSGTGLAAPSGTCYFRRTFTIATTGRHLVYWLTDNVGSLFVDGLHLQDSSQFSTLSTALVDLTAGDHTFAASVLNLFPPPHGPGGFAFALYTAGTGGEPVTLIEHSDVAWKILEYPPVAPGMTPGEVMRICVDEIQARGVLTGLALTFTDENDTAGNPWPEVADIATKVGTDVLTFFRELAGTYVDMWMEPGALRLSAWNFGTRGQVRPVTIESPTDPNDPDSGNLTTLIHRGTG